jgi:23S rRNA (uridine2552-2'-O)-methyltransferase
VVDLGAAPGGWSQVAVQRVGAAEGKGKAMGQVIGIDLLEVEPIAGADIAVLDFLAEDAPRRLSERLGGKADVLLSDMAANATGHKKTDHIRIVGLVELAAEFACEILAPGGAFLAKVIQGGTEHELLARLKREFTVVRHVKPRASRADSAELYVLATGFRGGAIGSTVEKDAPRAG